MKIAAGFLYVIWTIIYLSPLVPGKPIWYAIDRDIQILFIGILCYFLYKSRENTDEESLFFLYLAALCVFGGIYLLACLFLGVSFAIYNTPVFAYITGITLIVFMVHCALKKHD